MTNGLERWRKEKGLSYPELGRLLSLTGAYSSRRYCLPFSHPSYRVPAREVMLRIYFATHGDVTPNDFYDLRPIEFYDSTPIEGAA